MVLYWITTYTRKLQEPVRDVTREMTNDSEGYDMMEKHEELEIKQTWELVACVLSGVSYIIFLAEF